MNISEKLGVVGTAAGVIGIGTSIYAVNKVNTVHEMMAASVDKMANGIDVPVSQSFIDAAIDVAVDREVGRAVKISSREVVSRVREDMQRGVKDSISDSKKSINTAVSVEISRQVGNIDISDLKKQIIEESREKITKKFDGDLDNLLSEFNQNLSNISKIYNSIADSMTKRETVLKIG